ncbi:MAG: hypothetical protein R3A50_04815 [Saprospiraceae bacterium]
MSKVILIPSAYPMITDVDEINIDGIAAIILRNAGTATVNLFDGLYTLDSKETLSLNVTEHFGFLNTDGIPVNFDTTTGAIKKLQILVLKQKSC